MRGTPIDYKPIFVSLDEIPMQENQGRRMWRQRFFGLPDNKAAKLKYNNRQRAHQVRNAIKSSARYWGVNIYTRIIHAEPAIHGEDGWLLYFWKKEEEK